MMWFFLLSSIKAIEWENEGNAPRVIISFTALPKTYKVYRQGNYQVNLWLTGMESNEGWRGIFLPPEKVSGVEFYSIQFIPEKSALRISFASTSPIQETPILLWESPPRLFFTIRLLPSQSNEWVLLEKIEATEAEWKFFFNKKPEWEALSQNGKQGIRLESTLFHPLSLPQEIQKGIQLSRENRKLSILFGEKEGYAPQWKWEDDLPVLSVRWTLREEEPEEIAQPSTILPPNPEPPSPDVVPVESHQEGTSGQTADVVPTPFPGQPLPTEEVYKSEEGMLELIRYNVEIEAVQIELIFRQPVENHVILQRETAEGYQMRIQMPGIYPEHPIRSIQLEGWEINAEFSSSPIGFLLVVTAKSKPTLLFQGKKWIIHLDKKGKIYDNNMVMENGGR
ncbi:MAG: hypothetical protein ACK4G3_02880 [bacterium]